MSCIDCIVPHSKAHGVDFCSSNNKFHIVRPDIGFYMTTTNLNEGKDIEVRELHESCREGHHYLANNGYFYIIGSTEYRRVTNLTTDHDAVVYRLHPNCRNGDHYLSMEGKFYIIFQQRGVYRRTTDMSLDKDAVLYDLHSLCKGGLYYWGNGAYAYFLKPTKNWGTEYHKTSNMNHDWYANNYSFAPDVVSFLPGGIAKTFGAAFGKWELVKSFTNSGKAEIQWSQEISHPVGAIKSELSSIEHNWNIKTSGSYNSGLLAETLAKCQFKLEARYGGKSVENSTANWEDVTTVREKVGLPIPAGESIYLWQYRFGFGEKCVLFSRKMMTTTSNEVPTEDPLVKNPTHKGQII